jgi:Family of unknown function (DUF6527)
MKSMIRHIDDHGVKYDALAFICPGCAGDDTRKSTGLHMLPVNTDKTSPAWTWDGNLEAPTISPSILTGRGSPFVCHSFLKAGVFEFLGDCTHSLVTQNVPMPDLPSWFVDEVTYDN